MQSENSNDEAIDIPEPSQIYEKFLWAAGNGNIDILEQLSDNENILKYCDEDGYTALHRAASEGQNKAAKFLIASGADISAQTNDGWTPLHCACKWNNVEIAELLLQNGGDVNACSFGNVTPLHAAASEGNCREVLILLLNEEKINANIKNDCDETAFDLARRHSKHSALFNIVAEHINLC